MNNPLTFKSNDPNVQYVEVCELGEGEESFVYLARKVSSRSEDDVLVAVKQSKKEENRTKATGRNLIERFQFQAEHVVQLHHPNIVEVIEFVDPQETAEQQRRARPHLVMEYVEGVTLRQKMKPRRANGGLVGTALPLEDILSISEQTLSGLSHTHAQNPAIIHRDIRPEQLMITPDGRVKILDFGLAKELWSLDAEFVRTMITTGGGTWDYMAPEQIGLISKIVGEDVVPINYVPGTDVYTFGVTLYEMARGVVLPRKKEQGSMEHYVPHDADLTFLGGKIDLRPLIVRATQYDIDKRYPSAKAFLEALQQLREKYDAIVKGRGGPVAVPAELTDIVDAEFEEVKPASVDAVAETALVKPTGALVPAPIENLDALLSPTHKPWNIRYAPLFGLPVGAVIGDIVVDMLALIAATDKSISVVELFKALYTDPTPMIQAAKATFMGIGAIIGPIVGYHIEKTHTPVSSLHSPPTRALAAPDEGYKEGMGYRVARFVNFKWENYDLPRFLDIAMFVPWIAMNIVYGNRLGFEENHNHLLERVATEGTSVLDGVQQKYGIKARNTLAHNYATKMLEEGKYDEVEKTGADLVNRLIAASKKGRFRAWRERRQGRVLLEDICLGLISKGQIERYATLRTGSEYFLGKERVEQLDAIVTQQLAEMSLFLVTATPEERKAYFEIVQGFGAEDVIEEYVINYKEINPSQKDQVLAMIYTGCTTAVTLTKYYDKLNALFGTAIQRSPLDAECVIDVAREEGMLRIRHLEERLRDIYREANNLSEADRITKKYEL